MQHTNVTVEQTSAKCHSTYILHTVTRAKTLERKNTRALCTNHFDAVKAK